MRYEPKVYRSEQYNCQMNELMFQAGVKGMNERSELIPCIIYYNILTMYKFDHGQNVANIMGNLNVHIDQK